MNTMQTGAKVDDVDELERRNQNSMMRKFTVDDTMDVLKGEAEGGKFRKAVREEEALTIVRQYRATLKGRYKLASTLYCEPGVLHPVYIGKDPLVPPADRVALSTHYNRVVESIHGFWFEIRQEHMPRITEMTKTRDNPLAFTFGLMLYNYNNIKVYRRTPVVGSSKTKRSATGNWSNLTSLFEHGMFYVSVSECYAL